jgi:hypothetical protein
VPSAIHGTRTYQTELTYSVVCIKFHQNADPPDTFCLRMCCQGPCSRRAAEESDEIGRLIWLVALNSAV